MSLLLVEPENPDNIGAVCRAMKNMGLKDLRLVKPVQGWRAKGEKMAMGGKNILKGAKTFRSVQAAVKDAHLVVGTTRRGGPKRGMFVPFAEAMGKIKKLSKNQKSILMFGRESKGLDNDSLKLCNYVTTIPVHPDCPSINLAQAVMICSFSLFDHNTKLIAPPSKRGKNNLSKKIEIKELELLSKAGVLKTLDAFEEALHKLGYASNKEKIPRIRAVLERLFKRSGLLSSEAQMFKGVSRRICEKT